MPPRTATVLYIEDDETNCRLMEHIFAFRPHLTLVLGITGSLGLGLAQMCPQLILLDLDLPDMTGEVVLQRLRETPATAQIPVVIFSAETDRDRMRRVLAAGAQAQFPKPIVDLRAFLARLDALIQSGGIGE